MEFTPATSWQRILLITMLLAGSGWPQPEHKIIIHLGEDEAPAIGGATIGNVQNRQR